MCGDSLVDPGEGCDDGNPIEGDGCDSNCTITGCGNAVTSAGEMCDDGNLTSGDGCRADCLKIELCSDGLIDTALGEVCDDGNVVADDHCRADCKGTELCGDGLVDIDESCDGRSGCTASCTFSSCGDGTAMPGEVCLDGLQELVRSDDPIGAYDVVIGDIDGDGHSDVLWLDFGSFRVHRGVGNGLFPTETTFTTPLRTSPRLVDLDQDGDLDLVGIDQGPSLAYELNDGTGTFATAVVLDSIGLGQVDGFEVGDFDGDGDNDLVTSADGPRLLRNIGGLVFSASAITSQPDNHRVLAAGDVDGDGDLDLITDHTNATFGATLINTGNGTFTGPNFLGLNGSSFSNQITLVDLDGDGDLDILKVADDHLGVALNTGAGSFGAESTFATGIDAVLQPGSFVAGDLDDDGDVDVVLAAIFNISVFRNNGAGGLGPHEDYAAPNPQHLRLGDVDGDGDLDVATTSRQLAGSLTLNDEGVLAAARTFDVLRGTRHFSAASGDYNGDGDLDLVFANTDTSDLSILLGDGLGGFPTIKVAAMPGGAAPLAIATGKLDGDQDLDVVAITIASATTGKAIVFTNNGSATLASSAPIDLGLTTQFEPPFPFPAGIALGDLDEDGDLDLVAAIPGGERVSVLLGNGNGTFGAPTTFEIHPGANIRIVHLAVADLDGDGHLDLALANDQPTNPEIITMRGDGTGALLAFHREPLTIDTNVVTLISAVAVADIEGDGDLDILAACVGAVPNQIEDATITVLVNDGTGNTPTRTAFDAGGEEPSAMSVGDVDNDGDVDVAVATRSRFHVSVVRTEAGKPLPPLRFASDGEFARSPSVPTLADFNRDGAADLVWASGSTLHVLLAKP